jgi:hypothetical protein
MHDRRHHVSIDVEHTVITITIGRLRNTSAKLACTERNKLVRSGEEARRGENMNGYGHEESRDTQREQME